MSIIQFLLVIGAFVTFILYLKYLRTTVSDRIIGLLLLMIAVIAVLLPQLTTKLANIMGVGRGTDLVIYLFIVATAFSYILMRTRLILMEDALTKVVRHLAISEVEKGRPMNDKNLTEGDDAIGT